MRALRKLGWCGYGLQVRVRAGSWYGAQDPTVGKVLGSIVWCGGDHTHYPGPSPRQFRAEYQPVDTRQNILG